MIVFWDDAMLQINDSVKQALIKSNLVLLFYYIASDAQLLSNPTKATISY